MTKKHIYIYKNKKTQEVFADLFAKDLLEGVQLSLRLITLNPIHSWNSLVFISREFWK